MPAFISEVPPSRQLTRRLGRRLRDLLKRQAALLKQCRNSGTPDQIHELRTATRQLRVLLALGAPYLGRKHTRQRVEHARRLSRATSRLRDLDVTLSLVPATTEQTASIQRRRHRLWLRRRRDLTAPDGVPPRLDRLMQAATPLARRYRRKLEQHRLNVLAGLNGFADQSLSEQHAFRRTVRRLRYLRELGLSRRRAKDDIVCQALIRTQTQIGRLLDVSVCRTNIDRHHRPATADQAFSPTEIARMLRRLGVVLTRWQVLPHRA